MKWFIIVPVLIIGLWQIVVFYQNGKLLKALGPALLTGFVIVPLFYGINWLAITVNRVLSRWINTLLFGKRKIDPGSPCEPRRRTIISSVKQPAEDQKN